MSNTQLATTTGSMPTVPTSFVTDDATTAIPAANILNVLGGTGIETYANPDLSTNLYIKLANSGQAFTTTVGATTSEVVIINMGADPSIGIFATKVVGYATTGNIGVSYFILRCVKTDGVTATLVGDSSPTEFEDALLVDANAEATLSGNNTTITVTGVAGYTIDWTLETTFTAS
jgi:hypothetical protein